MRHRSMSALSTTVASSPFDGFTGDVTLRSSDGVDFHCFSQILVAASSVFEGMVAVGNPNPDPSSSASNRPIVPVTEDSKTLDSLLRFIYPIQKPLQPRSLEDIAPLFEASLKYMMEYPASILKEELLAFAQSRPMQVWAIGCRLMLEDVARAGAERMLHYRDLGSYTHLHQFVPIAEFVRTADARGVSAADYRRLWIYRHRRGEVEQDFSFTLPLPRQVHDQPASGDRNVPWAFFSSIVLSDATCHAADGKTFSVHKGLLCMNSPVLKEKIMEDARLAQSQGLDQSQHHLRFTEESPVLAHLLRLCYPGDSPLPEDHHLFLAVLKAAEKFDMTRIVDVLSAKWDTIAGARPASAYFAALHYGFPELARVAACRVPRTSPTMLLYVPEMEHAPAIHWQRLSEYWAAAEIAVGRVQTSAGKLWRAEPALVLPSSPESVAQFMKDIKKEPPHDRGLPCRPACKKLGPSWVRERRDDMLTELRRRPSAQDMPTVEELMRRSVALSLSEKPWCACCFNVAQDIVRLGTVFRQGMVSGLDEVRVSLRMASVYL
ncbi:hypothetical protein LXA43DRAFT_519570 [Ganoderma leucocontextum]|nr:hypothetical protein LXA43DRAFT_519570 [Ganoderma leucocontextum]